MKEDKHLLAPAGGKNEQLRGVCVSHEAFLRIHANKQIVNTDFKFYWLHIFCLCRFVEIEQAES